MEYVNSVASKVHEAQDTDYVPYVWVEVTRSLSNSSSWKKSYKERQRMAASSIEIIKYDPDVISVEVVDQG